MNKNKTKLMGFLIVAMAVVMIPFSTDAGTRIASRQLVSNPVTGEGPIFQSDGSMSSGAVGASNDLDDAYDNGNTIDFTDATTSADAVILAATTADDPDNYMTMTFDATQQFAFLTDGNFHAGNGTTDYVKINSNGIELWDDSGRLIAISATGPGGGSAINLNDSNGDNTYSFNTETLGAIFNQIGSASLDFRVESDNEVSAIFLDALVDSITFDANFYLLERATASTDIPGDGQVWVKDDVPNSLWFTDDAGNDIRIDNTVSTITANSGGGLQRLFSEATSGALSGATGTIQVNIPTGARILGVQLRVDTLIEGGFSFNAAYSGGSTQVIGAGINLTKNTKVSVMYDPFAATPIATSEVDILLTSIGGDFTAGVARALVYYEQLIPMDNNP